MLYKKIALLAVCLTLVMGLFAADIYVWGGNTSNGTGTKTNPYKYIQTAITTAAGNQQANTIYIRGRGTTPYTQNLSISNFQYALTITRWATYAEEVLITGTSNNTSTVIISSNSAMVKFKEITITRATAPSYASGVYGGGIYIYNNSSTIIDKCLIKDCRAIRGGGIYAENSTVQIQNSKLSGNTGLSYSGGSILVSQGGAIYSQNSNISISQTFFYNNCCGPMGTDGVCSESVYLSNGSLAFNTTTIINASENIHDVDGSGTLSFMNSIIFRPSPNITGTFVYCCAYDTNLTSFSGTGNIIADPKFVDTAAEDYSLGWDTSGPSLCIGTGYDPAYDDLGVAGYDQLNIANRTSLVETVDRGGFNYALDRYADYSFTNDGQGNWKCFPVIDDKTEISFGGETYRADIMRVFFGQYEVQDPPLTSASTKWYNQNGVFGTVTHTPSATNTYHNMQSFLGYKAIFNQASTMNELHGIHRAYNATVQVPETYTESWIGYFIPNTQTPEDAFGSFLDELYYIQAKDWTWARVKTQRGASWITTPGATLSYGDMVIVKKFGPDATHPEVEEFAWVTFGQSLQYVREIPIYFSYEKEPDYTPVFVQLDSLSTAKELAIMIGDECKGAAVVDNNVVMIQAFISSVPDGAEMQLVTWDGAKAASKPLSFNVYDKNVDRFVPASSIIKQDCDFYSVKLGGDNSGNVPETISVAISNYPNPFNPNTMISYNVPKEGNVKISIYNLKGQLIKTLINEVGKSGVHSIVWNGEDHSGNKVAAGIYFSRIETNGKTLTNKMLMLK